MDALYSSFVTLSFLLSFFTAILVTIAGLVISLLLVSTNKNTFLQQILFLISSLLGDYQQEIISRNFIPSGRLDGMVGSDTESLKLIQLNLKNDSLYQIIDTIFPNLELFNGPASYHRIIPHNRLNDIRQYLSPDYVHIMLNGTIVKSGKEQLAIDLEEKGYDWVNK